MHNSIGNFKNDMIHTSGKNSWYLSQMATDIYRSIYIYMCMCGVAISYQARLILLRPKSFVTICAIA